MALSAQQVDSQLDTSLSGVALLGSSCQAVIEAEIQRVQSAWWEQLDRELGEAETLVARWRRDGVLYFDSEVLDSVANCAAAFTDAREQIEALFSALEEHFDEAQKQELVGRFRSLFAPVGAVSSLIGSYLEKLGKFEEAMGSVQQRMETTVGEVQRNEVEIEGKINEINTQIASLGEQIKTDREAISKARSAETRGIVETIFGVLFAPLTGGASLILAGIGVASIAEAEDAVHKMESEISGYQQTISGDQDTLTDDQRIVATLKSLTLSTNLVLDDIGGIQAALNALRTTWTLFDGELEGVVDKLEDAADAKALIVSKAWYEAACIEWQLIAEHVASITGLPTSTTKVRVG